MIIETRKLRSDKLVGVAVVEIDIDEVVTVIFVAVDVVDHQMIIEGQ